MGHRRPGWLAPLRFLSVPVAVLAIVVAATVGWADSKVGVGSLWGLPPAGGNGIGARRIAYGDHRLFISDWGNNRVAASDNADNVVWSVEVGFAPVGLAVVEERDQVFVANVGDDTVTVFDSIDWNVHPVPIVVIDPSTICADGFASGDTSEWSGASPTAADERY